MLLEQLSRLPHAPSVPFQTTPPTTKVPEEVGEPVNHKALIIFLILSLSLSLELTCCDLIENRLDIGRRGYG